MSSPADLRVALLEGVNQARTAGKLAPLELAPNQTATNERLAPHFFDAELKADQKVGDTVCLGLMAGWDVQGTIRNGNLYSALLSGTSDANQWLDFALEMPMGRFTMLEAGARQIAVGVAAPGAVGGLGAVVTTYDLFTGNDHRADSARVLAQLAKARTARGLPAPVAIKGAKEVTHTSSTRRRSRLAASRSCIIRASRGARRSRRTPRSTRRTASSSSSTTARWPPTATSASPTRRATSCAPFRSTSPARGFPHDMAFTKRFAIIGDFPLFWGGKSKQSPFA